MNDNINILIQKYFRAETTLEEEKELKFYFSSQKVSKEHSHLLPLFHLTTQMEKSTKVSSKKIKTLKWRPLVAASVTLLFITGLAFWPKNKPPNPTIDWSLYEPQNEQEALLAAKEAFLLLSNKWNQSQNHLESNIKKIEKLHTIIK